MFLALLLSLFPGFLGEELSLNLEGLVIARVGLLLGGGVFSEGDFEDGEETFLPDGDEALFAGLPNINNLLFGDGDDHVQSLDLAPEDFGDPQGLVHELFSGLDGDEGLAFSEEEGECAGDVLAWVSREIP